MIHSHAHSHRLWADISLPHLQQNVRTIHQHTGSRHQIFPVLKANAYGHGAVACCEALDSFVDGFAVATLQEALELPTQRPILILGPLTPAEIPDAVAVPHLHFFISSLQEAHWFLDAFKKLPDPPAPRLHLKIDTGMGRIGILPDEVTSLLTISTLRPHIVGLATHLASADSDPEQTLQQLNDFHQILKNCRPHLPNLHYTHALNSAGSLQFSQNDPSNTLRPGLAIYGVSPLPDANTSVTLKPVLSWSTRVTLVRDLPAHHPISYGSTFRTPTPMRTATLAVGYADGLPRILSHTRFAPIIHNQPCPLLGRITMDQIVVDVTHLPNIQSGDTATLLGPPHTSANTLASLAQTIPYEILTGIQRRTIRVYHNS